MRQTTDFDTRYQWIVYAVAMLVIGALGGYVLSIQSPSSAGAAPVSASAPVSTATAVSTPVVDEAELRAYRDILTRDPKNLAAAVKAGNMLYDAQRYAEAVPFYQQAFALSSKDVNISTDLGTALCVSGHPDEAVAQYAKSLAIEPAHPQTLVNLGIVKSDGKKDYAGAVSAWQTLLQEHPDYPDAAHVRELMANAQAKTGVAVR